MNKKDLDTLTAAVTGLGVAIVAVALEVAVFSVFIIALINHFGYSCKLP